MNQKNSLGLDICFQDLDNPIELFRNWMKDAKKSEPNDPNALALATADKKGISSVRMVLLKDFSDKGFVFYTNYNSPKSHDLKENPNASMCIYWKSLKRQIRITGSISKVIDEKADSY
jgi:pyridoxamine 5'-phosphate oxidase